MIVRQPKAQPVFSPAMMFGSAAGISTSLTIRTPDRPMLRPTAMMVGLTVRNPLLTLIAIGQITELAMTKISEVLFIPNHRMASGSTAIDGSGLSIEVSSTRTSSPSRVQDASVVSTAATSMPAAMPPSRISRVVAVERSRSPPASPSAIVLATSTGPATSSWLTPENDT
ncbi:hypothetical protein LUX39_26030 [Actinomadura madurae]|nr:hypothetical protein [Actinomadura madurae]MCQ0016784.1 hypothetical protein [Actinomadura madurae]